MSISNKEQVLELLTIMFRYYQVKINETNINIYMDFLGDCDVNYINAAYHYFISESEIMPKIKTIKDYINNLKAAENANKKLIENDDLVELSDVIKDHERWLMKTVGEDDEE